MGYQYIKIFGVLLVLLFKWEEFADLFSISLLVIIVLFQSFIFSFIFYKLPYFNIEITPSYLTGPRSLGGGWQRIKIPIRDIDLNSINSSLQRFGFYIIKSYKGDKLSVWGFDTEQFNKLLGILREAKKER